MYATKPTMLVLASSVWILMTSWCAEFLYIEQGKSPNFYHRLSYSITLLKYKSICTGIELLNTEYWTRTCISVLHSQYSCSEATYTVLLQVYSFYSVYRIEKYLIAAKIFDTYRIVRHAYRYTPITIRNRAFILHMCIACDKTFHMVPYFFILCPWPWNLTYFWKNPLRRRLNGAV